MSDNHNQPYDLLIKEYIAHVSKFGIKKLVNNVNKISELKEG